MESKSLNIILNPINNYSIILIDVLDMINKNIKTYGLDPNLNYMDEIRFDVDEIFLEKYNINIENLNDLEVYDLLTQNYEIYLGDRNIQGWVFNIPIISNEKSMKIILIVKKLLYDFYKDKAPFRHYSDDNTLKLIRWIGIECKDFIHDLIKDQNGKNNKNNICSSRWKFLHKFWTSENFPFFMSIDDCEKIIENDKLLYFIRLSSSIPGLITTQYYNTIHGKVVNSRCSIDINGCIIIKIRNDQHICCDIRSLDYKFRKIYQSMYNILLKSIIHNNEDNAYTSYTTDDNYEYGY